MRKALFFFALFPFFAQAQSAITGRSSVCTGDTIMLADATAGGVFRSADTAVAAVDSTTGVVLGRNAGVDTIRYVVGTGSAIKVVTVNPTPFMSSMLTAYPMCDSEVFNYVPASSVAGTSFTWARAAISGIAEAAATGSGNPNELLVDTTVLPVTVAYAYTLATPFCSNTQTVTVKVEPKPTLSGSVVMPSQCDTRPVVYTPTSATPGATFNWTRPMVTGITPATDFGTGGIDELLANSLTTPVTVTYFIEVAANGCANPKPEEVTVTIEPCSLGVAPTGAPVPEVHISPNPVSDMLQVSAPFPIDNIAINSVDGRVVYKARPVATTAAVDVSALSAGAYFVTINNTEVRKFVKL